MRTERCALCDDWTGCEYHEIAPEPDERMWVWVCLDCLDLTEGLTK